MKYLQSTCSACKQEICRTRSEFLDYLASSILGFYFNGDEVDKELEVRIVIDGDLVETITAEAFLDSPSPKS